MTTMELSAPTAMPLEQLEAEITELAGHLIAAERRRLLLVAEFDRRSGYSQWGCRTCAHWLTWHCGIEMRASREKVRVGRALETLPFITQEFAAGKLSYSKVRALTRIATPKNETDLAELAEHATAVHVEKIVRAYRGLLSADDERLAANERHDAQYLRLDPTDDGSVNVDDDVLVNDIAEGVCELSGGPRLAPETVRRLMCDASAVFMLRDEAGRPVNVSNKTRTIPPSLRRSVHARDNGCRFPGCGERRFVDVHHAHHRARGGKNEKANLMELCWFHHRLVHEGGWSVRFDSGGVVLAITPKGNVLPRSRSTEVVDDEGIEHRDLEQGIAIEPDTCIPRWYGDPLDLNHVITGLWCIAQRARLEPDARRN